MNHGMQQPVFTIDAARKKRNILAAAVSSVEPISFNMDQDVDRAHYVACLLESLDKDVICRILHNILTEAIPKRRSRFPYSQGGVDREGPSFWPTEIPWGSSFHRNKQGKGEKSHGDIGILTFRSASASGRLAAQTALDTSTMATLQQELCRCRQQSSFVARRHYSCLYFGIAKGQHDCN